MYFYSTFVFNNFYYFVYPLILLLIYLCSKFIHIYNSMIGPTMDPAQWREETERVSIKLRNLNSVSHLGMYIYKFEYV
jgi:hypothetical protein